MRRRTFLQSTAGLAAVGAGCTGYTGTRPAATVGFYTDHAIYENREVIDDALHEAGLREAVTVEVIEPAYTTIARRSRFQQWLNAEREEPALLMMEGAWTLPFARDGLLDPLDAYDSCDVADDVPSDCFDATVTPVEADGSVYGVPFFTDAGGVFYRRDLFREAGYDPDVLVDDSPDWSRFASLVADVRDATDTTAGYGFQANAYEGLSCCVFREVLAALGGGYFGSPTENATGPIGERPVTVDTEPTRRALELFRGLIHGPDADSTADLPAVAPERTVEWTEEPSREAFAAGDLVAHRNWHYVVGKNGTADSFGSDLGLAPLPRGVPPAETDRTGTGGSRSSVGTWYAVPNPNAPHRERLAAGEVLNAMHTPTFRRALFREFSMLPPTPTLYDDTALTSQEPLGRYLDTYRSLLETGVPRPATRVWPQESQQISRHLNAVLRGERALDPALRSLQSNLETLESEAAR